MPITGCKPGQRVYCCDLIILRESLSDSMVEVIALRDTVSGTIFQPDEVSYFNPEIGQVATLDVLYDYDALRHSLDRDALQSNRDMSLWRYRELLPLSDSRFQPPLSVGWTPLYQTPRLANDLGLRATWVKDDGANPTGSLKDRASTMVVAKALERAYLLSVPRVQVTRQQP